MEEYKVEKCLEAIQIVKKMPATFPITYAMLYVCAGFGTKSWNSMGAQGMAERGGWRALGLIWFNAVSLLDKNTLSFSRTVLSSHLMHVHDAGNDRKCLA